MDIKKIKRLVRLAFLLINISFIGGIIELYLVIFPGLNNMFSIFTVNIAYLDTVKNMIVAVPAWPFVLMIVTIVLYLCLARYLYKYVCTKIEEPSSR
jgi:hypothetical protein